MSSSTSLLPSPGVSLASVPSASGNLLSNVQPPSALPSFVMTTTTTTVPSAVTAAPDTPMSQVQGSAQISSATTAGGSWTTPPYTTVAAAPVNDTFCPTQFR